jgi:hypothetical protein
MDIVKTIEDDEEVESLSEDSDAEVEVSWSWKSKRNFIKCSFSLQYEPTKQKRQKQSNFESGFQFV